MFIPETKEHAWYIPLVLCTRWYRPSLCLVRNVFWVGDGAGGAEGRSRHFGWKWRAERRAAEGDTPGGFELGISVPPFLFGWDAPPSVHIRSWMGWGTRRCGESHLGGHWPSLPLPAYPMCYPCLRGGGVQCIDARPAPLGSQTWVT